MRTWLVLLTVGVLAGCGFHLRGSQPLPYESIYVGAPANSELGAALRRSIRASAGTRIADSPQEAEAVLAVVGENREKVILTLDTAGRVREFQLRYRFVFRLHDRKGADLLPQTEILLTRDFTFNDSVLLAKEQEEALLYADMQNDLVQQIVRRLAAAKPPPG
jgi:LPS-assembly lipoprotein